MDKQIYEKNSDMFYVICCIYGQHQTLKIDVLNKNINYFLLTTYSNPVRRVIGPRRLSRYAQLIVSVAYAESVGTVFVIVRTRFRGRDDEKWNLNGSNTLEDENPGRIYGRGLCICPFPGGLGQSSRYWAQR